MLCTRCHEREVIRSPSPETRARMEQRFGAAWPFPDDLCIRCLLKLLKEDPAVKARFATFKKKANAKMLADARIAVRSGVLKVLDWADRVAERWGPK